MQNVVLMVTIAKRAMSERCISYFNTHGVKNTLGKYGRGTANSEMMNYLGIGDKEKCVLFSTVTEEKSKELFKEMKKKLFFMPGEGFAFTVPLSSIGSKKVLNYLVGEVDENKEEEYFMDTEYEVIMAISNRGYSDKVMEAAREAGAQGGTVMHARGTGLENSEKFFGATIGAEKELILIVAKQSERNNIMQKIKEKAGISTEAQAVMFSLPVSSVEGFTPIS